MLSEDSTLYEVKIFDKEKFKITNKKLSVLTIEEFKDLIGIKLDKALDEIDDIARYKRLSVEKGILRVEVSKGTEKFYINKSKPIRDEIERLKARFVKILQKQRFYLLASTNFAKTKYKASSLGFFYDIENNFRIYRAPSKSFSLFHINFSSLRTISNFRQNPKNYEETLIKILEETKQTNINEYNLFNLVYKIFKSPQNKFYITFPKGRVIERVKYINYHISLFFELFEIF